jgi:hypothetical protein
VVTSSINLEDLPVLKGAHKGMVCVRIFIGVSVRAL